MCAFVIDSMKSLSVHLNLFSICEQKVQRKNLFDIHPRLLYTHTDSVFASGCSQWTWLKSYAIKVHFQQHIQVSITGENTEV